MQPIDRIPRFPPKEQVVDEVAGFQLPHFSMTNSIEMEAIIVSLCKAFDGKAYEFAAALIVSNPDVLQFGEKPSLLLSADEDAVEAVRTILSGKDGSGAKAISDQLGSWLSLRMKIGFPKDGLMGPPPREERIGIWIAKRFEPYIKFLEQMGNRTVPENALTGRAICKSFRDLRLLGIDLPEVLRKHYTTRLLPSLVTSPLWVLAHRAGRAGLAEAILVSMGETDLQPGDYDPDVFFHNDDSYTRLSVERMIQLGMYKGLCVSRFFHWSTNTTTEWRLWALQLLLEYGSTATGREVEYPLLMPQWLWSRDIPSLKCVTTLLRQYGWTPSAEIVYSYKKFPEALEIVSRAQPQ